MIAEASEESLGGIASNSSTTSGQAGTQALLSGTGCAHPHGLETLDGFLVATYSAVRH